MDKIIPIKVVFLDIDGVLNSRRSHTAFCTNSNDLEKEVIETIDPVSIKLVNTILHKSNARIVASTSHRMYFHSKYIKDKSVPGFNYRRLQDYLQSLGVLFMHPLFGATPFADNQHRGTEIQMWLDAFGKDYPEYALEDYVIFDDSTDILGAQQDRWIQSTYDYGFSNDNYFQALKLLGVSNA